MSKVLVRSSEGIPLEDIIDLSQEVGASGDAKVKFSFPIGQCKKRKLKHINDCERHSVYLRTNDAYEFLKNTARQEDISPWRLAALFMARSVWEDKTIPQATQRKIYDAGMSIFNSGNIDFPSISTDVALTIISDLEIGKQKYQKFKKK